MEERETDGGPTARANEVPPADADATREDEELLWHGGAAPEDAEDAGERQSPLASVGRDLENPPEGERAGTDEESPRHGDPPQDRNLGSAGMGGVGEGSTR
jgi:hypothetical protein